MATQPIPTIGHPDPRNQGGKEALKAKLLFAASFASFVLVYYFWMYATTYIYAEDPFPFVPLPVLTHGATWFAASILAPIALAVKKKKAKFFIDPEGNMDADLYRLLKSPWTAIFGLLWAAALYVYIGTHPTLKLVFEGSGNPPTVVVNGESRPLIDNELVLLTAKVSGLIELSDSYGFYRANVKAEEAGETVLPFYRQRKVYLNRALVSKDFDVVYVDSLGKETRGFKFRFEERPEINDGWCSSNSFPVGECQVLLQKIFQKIFIKDEDNNVDHGVRRYRYIHTPGAQPDTPGAQVAELQIRDTNETSDFAQRPERGFELYWKASTTRRSELVREFVANIESLTDRKREIYATLWEAGELKEKLRGTPEERGIALEFIASVFPDAGSSFDQQTLKENIDLISTTNLVLGQGTKNELVQAIAAICALSRSAGSQVRLHAFTMLEDYFRQLKANSNNIKVEASQSIVRLITQDTNLNEVGRVLGIISLIYGNAADFYRPKIREAVDERRDNLNREDLRAPFQKFQGQPGKFRLA